MALSYEQLMGLDLPDAVSTYTQRDTMLYALGIGLGADPMDEKQLSYVYEDGLQAMPSMAVVLAHPGMWIKDPKYGLDWVKAVHGEQGFVIHKPPLPVAATVIGQTKVTAVVDKGKDKGAVMFAERYILDQASGERIATLTQSYFLRGDGGFGGPSGPTPPVHTLPESAPEKTLALPTLERAALIYRLSGDYNPLHADPRVGKAAGFPRPILHGLCTFGVATHAIVASYCDYQGSRLTAMQARFSSPVYPGETIRTEMWRQGSVVSFRARVVERDVVVLNNGRAQLG